MLYDNAPGIDQVRAIHDALEFYYALYILEENIVGVTWVEAWWHDRGYHDNPWRPTGAQCPVCLIKKHQEAIR